MFYWRHCNANVKTDSLKIGGYKKTILIMGSVVHRHFVQYMLKKGIIPESKALPTLEKLGFKGKCQTPIMRVHFNKKTYQFFCRT